MPSKRQIFIAHLSGGNRESEGDKGCGTRTYSDSKLCRIPLELKSPVILPNSVCPMLHGT